MSAPPPLSALSDPTSLGKTQILLVPVHPVSPTSHTGSVLTDAVYKHWTSLIKHHTSIRSDEIAVPSSSSGSGSAHVRGGQAFGPRARFFPSSSATSVSRANTSQYLHLTYPAHPPARHLYPLSLLRMTAFPLVVIGITVASDSNSGAGTDGQVTNAHARGYSVDSEEGDIGEASTPRAAQFQINTVKSDPLKALDDTLAEMLPPSSPFPLVKRVVVVPPHVPMNSSSSQMSPRKANGRSGDKRKSARKEVQYAPTEGAESWIAGLVGEVVGELLEELGDLVRTIYRDLRHGFVIAIIGSTSFLGDRARNTNRTQNPILHPSPFTHLHSAQCFDARLSPRPILLILLRSQPIKQYNPHRHAWTIARRVKRLRRSAQRKRRDGHLAETRTHSWRSANLCSGTERLAYRHYCRCACRSCDFIQQPFQTIYGTLITLHPDTVCS